MRLILFIKVHEMISRPYPGATKDQWCSTQKPATIAL